MNPQMNQTMTSQSANGSESQLIEATEHEIECLRHEQAAVQAEVKLLLMEENPANGVCYHERIFHLQQDNLRLDTEIQFLQAKLRRLKSTW